MANGGPIVQRSLRMPKSFAESGGKLVRLEFPKTEIQAYGNTVLIYTTYVYEIELNGKRSTSSGTRYGDVCEAWR